MVKYNNLQESSNLHQLNANKQIAALLTSRTEVSHRTIYQEVSMNSSRMIRGQFPIKNSYKQKDYKDYFRFPEGETLERSQQQRWRLVNPDITVAPNHIEYMGTWDLQWI